MRLTPGGARPSYDDVALTGRTLAALADVGTIFLVFLLAGRLYGAGAGWWPPPSWPGR